jgi:hypothetical protein
MNNNLTQEMLEKAKQAKSSNELFVLAKENGIELNEDQAKFYFERLNSKSDQISDEELDNVNGGYCPMFIISGTSSHC